MHIATNDDVSPRHNIISILPQSLRRNMYNINLDEAEEMRIIQGKPIFIRYPDGDYYVSQKGVLCRDMLGGVRIEKRHIEEILERITKSSLYSVKDEIKNGYITINGGHRIGLVGTAVMEADKLEFIKNISAMNIRFASEVIGACDSVIDKITDCGVKSTLILSPPGCGKTTLLRDIVRSLSVSGYCVAVADERCEIAAMHSGESAFELGGRTSVLENCPKSYAMMTLLRSMSPDVIVTDELGTERDAESVLKIINSGVSVIASVHAKDRKQLERRETFREMLSLFEIAVTLSKRNGAGTIESVECL